MGFSSFLLFVLELFFWDIFSFFHTPNRFSHKILTRSYLFNTPAGHKQQSKDKLAFLFCFNRRDKDKGQGARLPEEDNMQSQPEEIEVGTLMEKIEEEAGIGVAVSADFEDTFTPLLLPVSKSSFRRSEESRDRFTPLPFPVLKSSLKRSADRTNHDSRESLSLNPAASTSFAPSASMWDNESRLGTVINGSMAAAMSIVQFPRSHIQGLIYLI